MEDSSQVTCRPGSPHTCSGVQQPALADSLPLDAAGQQLPAPVLALRRSQPRHARVQSRNRFRFMPDLDLK